MTDGPLLDLLIDGLDDWNDAAWLVSLLCEAGGGSPPPLLHARDVVLGAVEQLLDAGLIEVGELEMVEGNLEFVPWPQGARRSMEEIEARWAALDRLPDTWELFWVSNTDAGDAIARTALEEAGE